MRILFITLLNIQNIDEHNIYADLMRELARNGHEVYIVSPVERRFKEETRIIYYPNSIDWHKNVHILKIKTGNIQKTNIIEKGISTVLLESKLTKAIKKHFKDIRFDLVTYSTPPITIVKPISFIKKRDNARTYLMLKDIFPQNAVDLGMLKTTGLKGFLFRYFRKKEKRLYAISDKIGCMSKANVDYVLENNHEIRKETVEIFPNCIEPLDVSLSEEEKRQMRLKYNIPLEKKVFVYGGNLGQPQGISFIIDCLKAEKENKKAFFLIVGDGTRYSELEEFQNKESLSNFCLMKRLPKEDYDRMIASCDVGLIFLDHRFTIPNIPSRFLSYIQAGLPVLASTDCKSDIGEIITNNELGWWCESNSVSSFVNAVNRAIDDYNFFPQTKDYLNKECVVSKYAPRIIDFGEKKDI